jgi:hypothetical protein
VSGGQGPAFATGDLVLKRVLDEREAEWLAGVLVGLPDVNDLRVIRPVASKSGRWVIGGWAAWRRLDGTVRTGAWRDALDVSRRFHVVVAGVPWSDAMCRQHPWAMGDRFAWGEQDLKIPLGFEAS